MLNGDFRRVATEIGDDKRRRNGPLRFCFFCGLCPSADADLALGVVGCLWETRWGREEAKSPLTTIDLDPAG